MGKKMIEATEINYHDAGYVADALGVKPNTLRKYASLIEEVLSNKARFKRDTASRSYSDADVDLIKKALRMHDEADITLKDAFRSVFAGHDLAVGDSNIMPNVTGDRDNIKQLIIQNDELKTQNAKIIKQNEILSKKLDEVLNRLQPNKIEEVKDKPIKPVKESIWTRLFKH